ncbi:G_PROTEIN_RECEP_F1_2 domain-containing protein [Meloidogyne graminicola]|uniref:G_PROTEIN_RECEP_F1_2 domain-containing protein n=1 Tax=Meloidogyne graminicola TaxID=189291 RepID=A0A8S9ZJH9_9BILA|nr:G_PROTEIN_RECEP_F1_2 domain-containing protein [Meloidogyne graminicola]
MSTNSKFSEWDKLGGPSLDPNYLSYKDVGINSVFFVPALIRAFMAFISILLNLSVCYITIKYRNKYLIFKSNTSILLGINSFFEILNQSAQFIFLVIAGSGINLIPFGKIVFFQIFSIIGYYSTIFMFTNLSFDRLLGVAFPILYIKLNKRKYIYLHLFSIILLNCYIIYIIIKSSNNYYEWPVNGTLNDFISIISIENNLLSSITFMFTPPLVLYFLIGLILFIKKLFLMN